VTATFSPLVTAAGCVETPAELQRHASFFWCDSDDDDVDVDICDFVSMLDGVDVC
jgi:hypothetical protein